MPVARETGSEDGVVSRGDSVRPGIYPLHSRFKRVVNFSAADHLISLVDEDVGAGPSNVVLKSVDLRYAGETLEITPTGLKTGEIRFSWPQGTPYSSALNWKLPEGGVPQSIYDVVIQSLVRQAPENSAVFVFTGPDSVLEDETFEDGVARWIRTGVERLQTGDWVGAAKDLRGVGFGLTPTGDDLLAGFLTGLNLIGVSRERIEEVYVASLGENAISNSMLFFAKEGRLFEATGRLLSAVCHGSVEEIPAAVSSVVARGATSGADFAVGLILGIRQEA